MIDAEGIYKLNSDLEVHQFLGKKPISSIQEAIRIVEYIRDQYDRNGIGRWAIIDKETNDFIGWAGLKYEEDVRSEFSYYDLGYRLRSVYWGNGIATEAARESLKYGFEKLGLSEVGAAADTNHVVSNRILKNLGFKLTDTFEYDDVLHNWYNIEKSNWLNR